MCAAAVGVQAWQHVVEDMDMDAIEEGEASYPGTGVLFVNILVNHARSLLYRTSIYDTEKKGQIVEF